MVRVSDDSLDDRLESKGFWGRYSTSYLWNVNVNNVLPRIPGIIAATYTAHEMEQSGMGDLEIAGAAPFVMRAVALPVSTALNYYWGRRRNRENTGKADNVQVMKYLANVGGVGATASAAWLLLEGGLAYTVSTIADIPFAFTVPFVQSAGIAFKRTLFSYIAINSGTFNTLENRPVMDSRLGRYFIRKTRRLAERSQHLYKSWTDPA